MFTKDTWKEGMKVWDVVRGEGVIRKIEDSSFPIVAEFEEEYLSYTNEGLYYDDDDQPSLYPYPVEVVQKRPYYSVFYPVPDCVEFKVGEEILVRDGENKDWEESHFVGVSYVDGEMYFLASDSPLDDNFAEIGQIVCFWKDAKKKEESKWILEISHKDTVRQIVGEYNPSLDQINRITEILKEK